MIFNITSGRKWIYDQITVTITGRTYTGTYDANNHSVSGYTVSISGSSTYSTSDFTFSGTASASGKNVGTYNMGMNRSQFTNTNPMYRNVTFVVTDGYVTINRKTVTCTAVNKTKVYGTPDPALTATVSGTLGSDTISYTISRQTGENVRSEGYTITPTGAATQGNYTVTYATGKLTITKAAASDLGLSVTKYEGQYNGSAHTVTAKVSVTSGTTIQYRTDNTNWSTTNPSRTVVGVTTVYVRAVNDNYNTTDTVTSSVTVTCKITVTTAPGASVKIGSISPITANSSGAAVYNTATTGNITINSTLNGVSASGPVSIGTTSATVNISLPLVTWLFKEGEGAKVTLTPRAGSYESAAGWGAHSRATASITTSDIRIAGISWAVSESESGTLTGSVSTSAINLSNYRTVVIDASSSGNGFRVSCASGSIGTFKSSRTTMRFDISSVTGSQGLTLSANNYGNSGRIYNWWLEV